jgi:hypothetical protein
MGDDQADQSGSIYSFGETNLAAERLRIVSEVFDSTSEAFLCETVHGWRLTWDAAPASPHGFYLA